MKPSVKTLGEILYSPSQYVIPYSSGTTAGNRRNGRSCGIAFLEIREPTKRGNHFMGFLVLVPGLAQPGSTGPST